MNPHTTLAQERLIRLASTLSHLRERVREAVAGEMGRAVGDAVRDLLTAVLHRRETPAETSTRNPKTRASPAYHRDPNDPWNDDDGFDEYEPLPTRHRVDDQDHDVREQESATSSTRTHWATALSVGVALARWFVSRRVPTLPALMLGILATAVTLCGGPVIHSSLAAVEVARDLIAAF